MPSPHFLSLSVHGLVDFLLRAGDIDNRVYNAETMQLGSKLHAGFQQKQGNDYLSEVPLQETFVRKQGVIALEGRADGIIVGGEEVIIDEIKSTVMPLKDFYAQQKAWHLGQAECYALMYLHQEKRTSCIVRLTYLSQNDPEDKRVLEFPYTLEELEKKVGGYLDDYLAFFAGEFAHEEKRNDSAGKLPFPFSHFRPGQREMAKYAYAIALKGGTLFCEAPTGIGKTMSVLYPCLKAFQKGGNEKIFYLTAKSSGRESAYQAVTQLLDKGLVLRDSLLTAKDKMCFTPGAACNPDECPFAKDYYTKLRSVLAVALSSGKRFDKEYVSDLARHYAMCPFELQLDLSLYSDLILCDYNYFFDPMVHLERFFDENPSVSKYLVLVDEAHNLIDRGRDMYSAALSCNACVAAKKSLRKVKAPALKAAIGKLEKALRAYDLASKEPVTNFTEVPKSVQSALNSLSKQVVAMLKKPHGKFGEAYQELSRESHRFTFLNENFASDTVLYGQREGSDYVLHLFCLDPSRMLSESLNQVKGRIIFSATLSPISYYMDAIAGGHDYPYLLLPSPFPKENFELLLAPMVSTRYKDRAKTYEEVAGYLESFVAGKLGNYFLYFPSYEYLDNIRPFLHFLNADVYEQSREMSDDEKSIFLSRFLSSPKKTSIGLLIIGGSFSEGIDLVADRLIGVAVVGIGLPQLSEERERIKRYFDEVNHQGYEYAYMNPGMNKVMQAVGRLIRSEHDVGAALLIDDRYMQNDYRDLFARTWTTYDVVTSKEDIGDALKTFYKKNAK